MADHDKTLLTVQTNVGGQWRDAVKVTFHEPHLGHKGATTTAYLIDYFADLASIDYSDETEVIDQRAVSIRHPVNLNDIRLPHWPSFLMDMLPQGLGRHYLSKVLNLNPVLLSTELPLVAFAAGSPVGNLRIKEAFEKEMQLPGRKAFDGLSASDVLGRTDRFLSVLHTLPATVPSAVNLQGEWPKAMLTLADDGLYYPPGTVPDDAVIGHYIVKMQRAKMGNDNLILELEAVYSAVAAEAGLDVHSPSQAGDGVLLIPRFDRIKAEGSWSARGQESIVSGMGVSAFAHMESHENYLSMIVSASTKPLQDIMEYLKRDILNLCFGNDDNHGRNTALVKNTDGSVRLSPLFDFAPMKLAGQAIARSSKWAVMRDGGNDFRPDWSQVVSALALSDDHGAAMATGLADFAESLPSLAKAVTDRCSDPRSASHATSRLEDIVRDVLHASDDLLRYGLR